MKRYLPLDVLRLVAIFLVLGRHMEKCPAHYPLPIRAFFTIWRRGGWVGVDLFFVLSGFLISGLLFHEFQKTGKLKISTFYIRRGFKIYPPFYTMIATTLLVLGTAISGWQLVAELFFVQSYLPGIWNHTWSLAVEEHFYILLPLFLLLLIRWDKTRPFRWVPWAALGLGIFCLAGRILTYRYGGEYSHIKNLFATHLRLDALFFGVTIGYVFHFHQETFVRLKPWRFALIALGICLLSPAFVLTLETTPAIYTVGLTAFYIGSGAILAGSILCEPKSRGVVALAFLGVCSYSTYLWHVPVLHWIVPHTSSNYFVRVVAFIVLSLLAGIIAKYLIEDPALRLRKKWFPPVAN
ncbi:hypothetical protein BH10PLA2_BH10PLA2_17570 [soil metagenome]